MDRNEEYFVQSCMQLDHAICELLEDKDIVVCIAVLTKLVGEVLFDMQQDPTDHKEGKELLEKARLSVLEAYTTARDDDDTSEPLH